jgi:hypothetical protein
MLKKLKPWRAWIVGGLGLVALVWIVESSQSFQSCVKNAQYQAGEQTLKKHLADFSVLIRQRGSCIGFFIHRNEGAITALATLLIALFTLTLWRSTDKLWEAGERQLRLSEDTAQRQLRAYISHQPLGAHFLNGHLKYFEQNFGKTPAKDVQMFVCVKDGSATPQDFKGPFERIEFMSYIAPGQNIGKIIPGHTSKPALFLYGYVDYSDAFERKWRRRFAVSYDFNRSKVGDEQWIWHNEHNDEYERKEGVPWPT